MLTDEIQRTYADTVQVHTRSSILQLSPTRPGTGARLSQTLGINGLPQPDLWRPD